MTWETNVFIFSNWELDCKRIQIPEDKKLETYKIHKATSYDPKSSNISIEQQPLRIPIQIMYDNIYYPT